MNLIKIRELYNQYTDTDIKKKLRWITSQIYSMQYKKVTPQQIKTIHYAVKFGLKEDVPNWKAIKSGI